MAVEHSYYDLHVHGWRSPDSQASYTKIFAHALANGLSGLAITDHDKTKAFKRASELAEETGLHLLGSSAEVTTTLGINRYPHILAIHVPHEELTGYLKGRFPYNLPQTEDFLVWMQQFENSLAIGAHPATPTGNINSLSTAEVTRYSELLDGIEVVNTAPHKRDSQRATLARNLGLAQIGGSDAHRAKHVGRVSTEIPGKQKTVEAVIYAIKDAQSVAHVK